MDTRPVSVLSLCSGLGGLELGLGLAGIPARSVCYVENEAYICAVLASRMQEGVLDECPIWTDLRTFDGRGWRGKVDLVTAGYPCQGFSDAGLRRGLSDPRYLWPEVNRVVSEVGPVRVFCENVDGHLRRGFDVTVDDLVAGGYRVAAGLFSAAEVGAPHRRQRLFFLAEAVAHAQGVSQREPGDAALRNGQTREEVVRGGRNVHVDVADTDDQRRDRWPWRPTGRGDEPEDGRRVWTSFPPGPDDERGWTRLLDSVPEAEPAFCVHAHGFPDRMDTLRALGNAVVPRTAALAYGILDEALTQGYDREGGER